MYRIIWNSYPPLNALLISIVFSNVPTSSVMLLHSPRHSSPPFALSLHSSQSNMNISSHLNARFRLQHPYELFNSVSVWILLGTTSFVYLLKASRIQPVVSLFLGSMHNLQPYHRRFYSTSSLSLLKMGVIFGNTILGYYTIQALSLTLPFNYTTNSSWVMCV